MRCHEAPRSQGGCKGRKAKPISSAHVHSKPPSTTSLSTSSPCNIHGCERDVETAPTVISSGHKVWRNISTGAALPVPPRGYKEWVGEDVGGLKVV